VRVEAAVEAAVAAEEKPGCWIFAIEKRKDILHTSCREFAIFFLLTRDSKRKKNDKRSDKVVNGFFSALVSAVVCV